MNISKLRTNFAKKVVVWSVVINSLLLMLKCLSFEPSKKSSSGTENMIGYVLENKDNLSDIEKSNLIEAIGIKYLGEIRRKMQTGNFEEARGMIKALENFYSSIKEESEIKKLSDVKNKLKILEEIKLKASSKWKMFKVNTILSESYGTLFLASERINDSSNAYYQCYRLAEMSASARGLTVAYLILYEIHAENGVHVANYLFLLK